ncbi:MAG: UDP-3-O-(3-hydroxymyristoyl)glucosamine N-acyltransferase [Deltaproteobacteria bacterium]|nr:UDP-3-O-(3-hydroxymyristoyl)glucosamine N-acyltransferase [Deltaproteobacteria bacterium]
MSSIRKSLGELAGFVGGEVSGDGEVAITGVASLEDASQGDITFIANPRYIPFVSTTRASAIIASADMAQSIKGRNILIAINPYLAFARVLDLFTSGPGGTDLKSVPMGIHPKAELHPTARIGSSPSIYPFVYIGEGVRVGDRVTLFPGVYIGRDVTIGDDVLIYSNVSIREDCRIGNRVIIHCNAVIGSDGFGFAKDGSRLHKIPQTGIVRIEDDVEIGACVTIDRATLGETAIRRGTKIDNLVQIAHNVEIGEDSIIVAQVGIAGSAKIGSRVELGGQVGVVGHIAIGDDVKVGAQSGVAHDLPSGQVFSGSPAIPHKDWLRAQGIFAKLPEMRKTLLDLERKVRELEEAHKLEEK